MFLRKDQLTFGVVPLADGCHSAQSVKSERTRKSCENTRLQLVFPDHFSFFQTFTRVSIIQ